MVKLYHHSNQNDLKIIKANPFACFSIHPESHDDYGRYCYVMEFEGILEGDYGYVIANAEKTIRAYDNNEYVDECDLEICFDYDIEIDYQL